MCLIGLLREIGECVGEGGQDVVIDNVQNVAEKEATGMLAPGGNTIYTGPRR